MMRRRRWLAAPAASWLVRALPAPVPLALAAWPGRQAGGVERSTSPPDAARADLPPANAASTTRPATANDPGPPGRPRPRPAWPPRRLRLVVAYPPGGLSADVAQALSRSLADALHIPVVTEPRPGAGGVLAVDTIAKAPPDGAHLVYSAITPLTLAPLLGRVPYDPVRDVLPVIGVVSTPVLIVAGAGAASSARAGLADLLERARQAPGAGALRWASSGFGTTGHMVMERIAAAAGVNVTHVPYTGGGRQLGDAIGGQFELLSTNLARGPVQLVRTGRLRALAVTGQHRSPALPEVPTVTELGYAGADLSSVFGLFAPGGTPPFIVARWNQAVNEVLRDPSLRRLALQDDPVWLGGTPADLAAQIDLEREAHRRWHADHSTTRRR